MKRLRFLVSKEFQELFHSPSGVLFTFPSRYLYAIDLPSYLALDDGPPRFMPDFTCPTLLRNILPRLFVFTYRAITFFGIPFQEFQLTKTIADVGVLQPRIVNNTVWALPLSFVTT